MPFSYMEAKKKMEKAAEKTPDKTVEGKPTTDAPRGSPGGPGELDGPPKGESRSDPVGKTEQDPEHVCEGCFRDFGIKKSASRKVRMSGREEWLCDSCLQAAGYKEGLD